VATFGERFKELRKNKGYTQAALANILHLNKSSISRYEKDLQLPEASSLSRIAEFFEVSIDYLMGSSGEEENKQEILIPKEYSDKYKVTSRDKKQYLQELKKINESFFMNDEFDEDDKKEILDTIAEMFWIAKSMKKRKK
jgi:transcriptional regulator with XRE-family HTH domain